MSGPIRLFQLVLCILFVTAASVQAQPDEADAESPQLKAYKNEKEKLSGPHAEHFVPFQFSYPPGWKLDPKAGTQASPYMVRIERRISVGKETSLLQENLSISHFDSSGKPEAVKALVKSQCDKAEQQIKTSLIKAKIKPQTDMKFGAYAGRGFDFNFRLAHPTKKEVAAWGRFIVLTSDAIQQPSGLTIIALGSAEAPELTSLKDLGEKGGLATIIKSFNIGEERTVANVPETPVPPKPPATPPKAPATPPSGEPAPPTSATKPQAPAPNSALLPAVGSLSTSQALVLSRYLSLLATAHEKDLVTAKEVEERVTEIARGMPAISEYLKAAKTGLTSADSDFISTILELHELLRNQVQHLAAYTRGKDAKELAATRSAAADFDSRYQKMIGNITAASAPGFTELDKSVNAIGAVGDKFSQEAGPKFDLLFTDENLKSLVENRKTLSKAAQEIAELLTKAAAKYREAAELCEKESKKKTSDAPFWEFKGSGFRKLAEAKEGFRALALLIQEETITDKAGFDSRAKPLLENALKLNTESQKLIQQSVETWKKLHPGN